MTSQIQEQKTSTTTDVWLWSNFNAKLSDTDNIDNTALHVFLNSFVPLMNNIRKFDNKKMLLFVRRIGNTDAWHGSKEVFNYKKFEAVYGVQDFTYDKIFLLDADQMQIKKQIELDTFKIIPDDNTQHGRTTGFMAYAALMKMFPNANMNLVNFNRKNNGKYPNNFYQDWHNIDAEEQYFNDNKVNRITIGH